MSVRKAEITICPFLLTAVMQVHKNEKTRKDILEDPELFEAVTCLGKGYEGDKREDKNRGRGGCQMFSLDRCGLRNK